jgi:hypothetical protein
MISIVCVYNDVGAFERCLVSSLRRQSAPHELIPIDNRGGLFIEAAAALNHGASSAHGDWILFAHQDVSFISDDWLSRAERILDALGSSLGWAGVVGRTIDGDIKGFLIDRDILLGSPLTYPEEVQTLDECILICRRHNTQYFEVGVSAWHVYGVHACLVALEDGRQNYALPLLVHHESPSTNTLGLDDARRAVWDRHGDTWPVVWTTWGKIGPRLAIPRLSMRMLRGASRRFWKACRGYFGWKDMRYNCSGEIVDALIPGNGDVHVLHQAIAAQPPIYVTALYPQPLQSRNVCHCFTGLELTNLSATQIVISEDLAKLLPDAPLALTKTSSDIVVCIRAEDLRLKPKLSKFLQSRCKQAIYAAPWDNIMRPVLFSLLPAYDIVTESSRI